MRIALLADIHGNAFALEQVLGEPEVTAADMVVRLGDIAVLGPDPATSIDRVRARADRVVRGNTDEWLVARRHMAPDVVEWAVLDTDGGDVVVSFRQTTLPMVDMMAWAAGFGFPQLERWQKQWARGEGRAFLLASRVPDQDAGT